MKEYLNRLPHQIQELIRIAADIAEDEDIEAYLVGGFVRDLILEVKNLDLDIVVEAAGIKFAQRLSERLHARLTEHKRFGTAAVVMAKPHLKVDVATCRKEFYPQPAQLPVVSKGALEDDLFRRDFTINAMAISINKADFGRSVDFYGGLRDLKKRHIRILHDLSFCDDPTRILRAIRFEQRYNFKIEHRTLKLLRKAVSLKFLDKVEPQRIRDDLILLLKEKDPLRNIRRLEKLAGLSFINKKLSLTRKTDMLLDSIEGQIAWFNKNFTQRRFLDSWLMYFIGMLDSLSLRDTKDVCRRFALRRGEEKRILAYKSLNPKLILELSKKGIQPTRIFSLLEPLSYETILLIKAKYSFRQLQINIADFFQIYNGMRVYVSGQDLKELGVPPGPFYKKIFAQVLTARVNGLVKSKDEELRLIRKLISKG